MAAPRVPASPVHMAVVLGAATPFWESSPWKTSWRNSWVRSRTSRTWASCRHHARGEGRFEADGRLTLDVAERELGVILPPLRPDIETLGAYVQATWATRCGRAAPLTWWISLHRPEIRDGRFADYAASLCHMRTKATLRRSSRRTFIAWYAAGSAAAYHHGRFARPSARARA